MSSNGVVVSCKHKEVLEALEYQTTKYYDADTTVPFFDGIYKVITQSEDIGFSYWNGEMWGEMASFPHMAFIYRFHKNINKSFKWAGIVIPDEFHKEVAKIPPEGHYHQVWYIPNIKPVICVDHSHDVAVFTPTYKYKK